MIAICGIICGADDCPGIEEYGMSKEQWLRGVLGLPHGIPSQDTIGRVFRTLDVEEFANSFMAWVREAVEVNEGQVIAVDGKVLRGSHDGGAGKAVIDMVSAWPKEKQVVLGVEHMF